MVTNASLSSSLVISGPVSIANLNGNVAAVAITKLTARSTIADEITSFLSLRLILRTSKEKEATARITPEEVESKDAFPSKDVSVTR